MSGPWTDLDRPPLSAPRLVNALCRGGLWCDIRVVESTASTNADVSAAAAAGAPEGTVVIAEEQNSGRGRLDRRWESPSRAGILLSVLLRPDVPAVSLPLLPLLTGVAVAEAVRAVTHVEARLKWPNDVLIGDRKLGGILVERTPGGALVVGVGLNVSTRSAELAVDTATSIAIAGGVADRESLVKEMLRAFERRYAAFVQSRGASASLLPAYRELCATIGRRVRISAPGGVTAGGVAIDVNDGGMLVVRDDGGTQRAWSAGDVIHVRAEE